MSVGEMDGLDSSGRCLRRVLKGEAGRVRGLSSGELFLSLIGQGPAGGGELQGEGVCGWWS